MMYQKFRHEGKSLPEWKAEMGGMFSLGELYRMAKKKVSFLKISGRRDGSGAEAKEKQKAI